MSEEKREEEVQKLGKGDLSQAAGGYYRRMPDGRFAVWEDEPFLGYHSVIEIFDTEQEAIEADKRFNSKIQAERLEDRE